MAFTRYGDYPMTGNNGLTDITIPIHTIVGRSLSLPITTSFHASGMMAGETDGLLGMRWTLNCGGLVTRTMKGTPDEWSELDPFDFNDFIENTPSSGLTFEMLYNSCTDGKIPGLYYFDIEGKQHRKYYDSEYDIFSYSLPNGKSGHFILKGAAGSKVAMTIPYDPIKIEFAKASTWNGYIENLTITDVDGTRYKFGRIDAQTVNAVEGNDEPDIVDNALGWVPTAWYLTKIISSGATDEISLFYNTRSIAYYSPKQIATIRDRLRQDDLSDWIYDGVDQYLIDLKKDLVMWHYDQTDVLNEPIHKNNVPMISSIQFNGGSAFFYYTPSSNLLSNIIVNRGNVPYKKVLFNYALPVGALHYLNDISFYGEDLTTVAEKYGFSYYSGGYGDPQYEAKIRDWWGYQCSGRIDGLILNQTVPVSPIPSGLDRPQVIGFDFSNRNASESSKMTGMLKTIKYPTGGQTEFIYENNKYDWSPYYEAGVNAYTLDGPGLRIKEVISTPVKGRAVHKIYKYGIHEDGRGFINEHRRPGSISFTDLKVMESNTMHYWTWVVAPGQYGGINQSGHRTRRYFADPYISFDLSGSDIKYDAVTEYVLEAEGPYETPVPTQTRYSWGNNAQISTFNVTDHDYFLDYSRKFYNPEDAWRTPVMTGKTFYKYDNGQFVPIKNETYTYNPEEKDHAWDMPTYLHTNVVYAIVGGAGPSGYSGTLDNYLTAKSYHSGYCSVYGWGYRKYVTGSQTLWRTTIEEFTPAGTMFTQKQMNYEGAFLFLRSEEITNSKNEVITTTYRYPKDFENISPYNEMVNRNVISPVVEQVQTNTALNKELARTKTNYNFWQGNTIIEPAALQKSILGNPLQTEYTIDVYDDKGNILQVTSKDGIVTSYVWGYDQKYPVAKIIGRPYADAISQSGIDLTVVNNSSLPDATIRTEVNKLRSLSNCFVSTYTYKPLIGMSSETDPDGRTIYYEYDMFGRLALTRDKDNNILKKFAYDYQGQCTTCGTMTTANWQRTGSVHGIPCELNVAFNGPYRQWEEKDVNPTSATYNQTRWVDELSYNESIFTKQEQYWVNTSTPPRCILINGQNSGAQEQEQVYKDPNPCHVYNNEIRWKNTGTNTSACPLPALWTSADFSGNYYSTRCTLPAEPDPKYVPVPAGMFTSAISPDDANEKALQYAQTIADNEGTCTVPPVTLNFINNTGWGMTVTLTDATTGTEYTIHSVQGASVNLPNLPQGIYHLYMWPADTDRWIYYEVGCNLFFETKGEVWVDDITINATCHTITAN
jgi:YD repeat-containing protein